MENIKIEKLSYTDKRREVYYNEHFFVNAKINIEDLKKFKEDPNFSMCKIAYLLMNNLIELK